jgi:hypothetical protein
MGAAMVAPIESMKPLERRGVEKIFQLDPIGAQQPNCRLGIACAESIKTAWFAGPAALDFERPDALAMSHHEIHFGIAVAPGQTGGAAERAS